MTNPLLSNWTTAFEIAPFAEINDSDFLPAFETALAEDLAEVEAIAENPELASFANTIEALLGTGKKLDRVAGAFYTVEIGRAHV